MILQVGSHVNHQADWVGSLWGLGACQQHSWHITTPRRTLEFGEFIGVRSMRKSWDGSIDFYWLNEDLGATGYRKLQKILIHFKRTLDDFPLWSWEEPCFSRFFLSDRVSIQEWKPLIDRRYLHLQSITWHVDKIALNSFNWLTIIHLSSQKTQYVCMYLYILYHLCMNACNVCIPAWMPAVSVYPGPKDH